MRPYAFNSPSADHLISDRCSGWIDTHATQAVERPPHPTSNPAGHQLGCASVIQPATQNPPFPVDDTLPHGRPYWPCPFIFIRVYHCGGLPNPRGPPPPYLWSCLTHCLQLSLRYLCVFSSTLTFRSTRWQVQWQPITLKQFCFQHDHEEGEWGASRGQTNG